MTKTKELNSLFIEWRNRHPGKLFAEDGVIEENLWNQSNRKILFIFKEANKSDQNIRKGVINNAWWQIQPWAFGLKHTTAITIPSYKLAYDNSKNPNIVSESAILNLKKIPGKATANMPEVESYAIQDKDLIIRQVNIIKPQIVLCGGTFEIIEKVYPENTFIAIDDDKRCYVAGEVLWIKYHHYGLLNVGHDILYYALMHFFQKALKNPIIASLKLE